MRKHLIAFALAALTSGAALAANIAIVNPSFELAGVNDPLTSSIYSYNMGAQPYGWTIDRGNMEFVRSGYIGFWTAQDGQYSVDMNGVGAGNTILSQMISGLTPGNAYLLQFGLSSNLYQCRGNGDCTLTAAIGQASATFNAPGGSIMSWLDESISFVADSSSMLLSFTDNSAGNGGSVIDNVRITEAGGDVPEPGSILLVAVGLIGFGLNRQRATRV